MTEKHEITKLLHGWRTGDQSAVDELSALVYDELHQMACHRLAGERAGHTLQPTALVNEAYLRLVEGQIELRDRVQFFSIAALHMRSILVDHARARLARKRGGGQFRVTFSEDMSDDKGLPEADLLVIDQALRDLEINDPRTAQIIDLTYFAGLKRDEVAHALDVSLSTVDRNLRFGRVWLKRALAE